MVQENQISDIPQSGEEKEKRFGHPHTREEMDNIWESPLQGRDGHHLGHPHSRGEKDNVWDIPTPGERWERLGHPQALQIRCRQNLYQRENTVTQFLFTNQDLSKAQWIHPKQCTQIPQILIVY